MNMPPMHPFCRCKVTTPEESLEDIEREIDERIKSWNIPEGMSLDEFIDRVNNGELEEIRKEQAAASGENSQEQLTTAENGGIIEKMDDIFEDKKDMDDNVNGTLIVNLQYFANKNIPKMSNSELEHSISSWNDNIKTHKDKLENPRKYYPDWDSYDPRYQAGLRRHWQHEINTFENDINDANDELKKR